MPIHQEFDEATQVEKWIRAAQDGCHKSLEHLISASRGYLWKVARSELPIDLQPKIAPSDLVQETLIEAHRDFSDFVGKQPSEFWAWLRRILLNNLANASRHYRDTSKRDLTREVALDLFDSATQMRAQRSFDEPSPDSAVAAQEQVRQVEIAVERLSSDHREVVLLRHRDHLSFDEIAKRLQCTAEVARKRWSRAIERLQEELNPGNEQS